MLHSIEGHYIKSTDCFDEWVLHLIYGWQTGRAIRSTMHKKRKKKTRKRKKEKKLFGRKLRVHIEDDYWFGSIVN